MSCHCTRTVLEPPIQCGTKIFCSYPCDRPPPPCGHRKHPHLCHEDPTPCPPCSFLTGKPCACGKNTVENVICSREKVFCGTPCGKSASPVPIPGEDFLRPFPGFSSAVSTDAIDCVTLMTVDRVRIPAESHASCGKSITVFLLDHLLTLKLQPPCHPPLYGSVPRSRLMSGDRTLHYNGDHHLFMRTNTSVRAMWSQALQSFWRRGRQDPHMHQ
jgi:hypothetical protein